MPLGLLRYGLARRYPAGPDLPATPDALRPSYDVAIIGGGGHGLAAAYYLARDHGVTNVCVLEKSWMGGGNTARNTAVIRANYASPGAVRFHKESIGLYAGLSAELGFNILYSRRGQITLAYSDAHLRGFRQRAEVNKMLGVRSEMVDVAAVRRIVPSLAVDPHDDLPILGALWHADGGTARHDAVAWGYARAAARRGVEIHQRTGVTGFRMAGGRVDAIETTRGPVRAGAILQAVAGMSSEVARWAGIALPIRTIPLQAMVSEPLKPFLDPLVSSPGHHVYVSQTARGEIVIGGNSDPHDLYATRSTLDWKEETVAGTLKLFPFLAGVKVMRQWAGITDVTPDYSPILGETPVPGYWIDAGQGTWGFKSIPVCGKRMAQAIATGRVPAILHPYRLDRFRTYDLVPEMGSTAASH